MFAGEIVKESGSGNKGLHVTSKGVRVSYGPPPTVSKTSKGKEVETHGTKKTLGVPKSKIPMKKKYGTRSSMNFKSKFFANNLDPIDIE